MKSFLWVCILSSMFVQLANGQLCKPFFLVHEPDSVSGFFFVTSPEKAMILDKFGNEVYFLNSNIGNQVYNFSLQPNGMLSYSNLAKYFLMDSTFRITDSIDPGKKFTIDKHELQVLPGNEYLILGMDSLPADTSSLKTVERKGVKVDLKNNWGSVGILNSKGKILFDWHSHKHFKIEDADTFFARNGLAATWTHVNSAELDNDGNILLSSRNFSEVTKINRKTGKIMWRLGGVANQFRFINCPIPFYGQHDVRSLFNGNITLLDNGNHTQPHGARAIEFKLDEKNMTAELVWSYSLDSNQYSTRLGNVQRLPDGNTLINFGLTTRESGADVNFVIVNKEGKRLLEAMCSNSYRVFNYPSLPFELKRPVVSCFDVNGRTFMKAPDGFKSYQWNTGDTTQIILVNDTSSYSVFVPYGERGFIGSKVYTYAYNTLTCKAIDRPLNDRLQDRVFRKRKVTPKKQ